ncbi:MAG: hypothetical protein ACXVHS_10090 [Methanobacterium sp.]
MGEDGKYTVKIGSNLVLNCDGCINLVGKELNKEPIRFREGDGGKIFLDCTVYNQECNVVFELVNNFPKNVMDDFEVQIENSRIVVIEKSTANYWFDFLKLGPNDFRLNGRFYYPGIEIMITDEYLIVNGHPLTFKTFTNCENVLNI